LEVEFRAFAAITEAGQTMRDRMWSIYGQGIENYFADHLDVGEVMFLIEILDRMTKAIDEAS
jgi:hypothetical protein